MPSEAEIRSHREGERVLLLRRALANEPGPEWRALARRLIGAVDGERLVAALLAQSFASVETMPVVPPPAPVAAPVADQPFRAAAPEARERPRDRDRDRDRPPRPAFGDRPDRELP